MGLYRRKDSKTWWMSFNDKKGNYYRQSTGTTDKKLAKTICEKVQTLIAEGKWLEVEQSSKFTLEDMIERYNTEYTQHKDNNQKKRDKTIFKYLYQFFGDNATLQEVGNRIGGYEPHRRGQITIRGKSPDSGTIRKELALLRRMFNIARKQWKWKIRNPFSDIELPADSAERVRYLNDDEFRSLLKELDAVHVNWLKAIVLVAIGTGLRLGNLINLVWSEVNMAERCIIIAAEKMKNKDYLGNPLTDIAFDALKGLQKVRYLHCPHVFHDQARKLQERRVQKAFERLVRRAGIKDFHFHDLRHCYASYLRQCGVDLHEIAKLMGHKDLRMTNRYAHLNMESLRKQVKKLDNAFSRFYHVDDSTQEANAVNP